MRMTQRQLEAMEQSGAKVTRQSSDEDSAEGLPFVESPEAMGPEPQTAEELLDVAAETPSEASEAADEALRILVAKNTEVMQGISKVLQDRNDSTQHDAWDGEIIRDQSVKGDYKPITHIRLRAVRSSTS